MPFEVACADLGLVCNDRISAASEEELAEQVRRHAADRHDVPQLNDTLVDYALSRAHQGSGH